MRFQHADNSISINDAFFPYDWWITQEPGYTVLPANAIGRLYIPTKRHRVTVMKNDTPTQFDGGLDKNNLWLEGDGYIAKEQVYADAYAAHIAPPPLTPEEQEAADITDVLAESEQASKTSRILEDFIKAVEADGGNVPANITAWANSRATKRQNVKDN